MGTAVVRDPRRTEWGGGRSGGEGEETYGHGNGGDPTGARDPRRTEGGGEPSGGRARADEWERMMEELDESDIRACGGFLPLGRTGLASGTLETENGTGLAGGTLETENGTGLAGGTLDRRRTALGWAGGTLDQAENGTGLAGGTLETENGTGLAGGTRMRQASGVAAGLGGISPTTGEAAGGESVTNEPNCR